MISDWLELSPKVKHADAEAMLIIASRCWQIDQIKEVNQLKMLRAFTTQRVAAHHLAGSTGYGYNDAGREKLEQIFAAITGSEAALFRPHFMSGTHALTVALFGLLRPGHTLLCATGRPYDTLAGVIGLEGAQSHGSLAEFGVHYRQLELQDGQPDLDAITAAAPNATILYLQRSRGYASRPALLPAHIEAAAKAAKAANPAIYVVVDNCYGEFVDTREPTEYGADLIVGSLIKNPGGGIAPSGGYIAGKAKLVELCAHRLSAPGVGAEVGSMPGDVTRQLYLGLYNAPAATAEALKAGAYAATLFEQLGYETHPKWYHQRGDIITAITMGDAEQLKTLCRGIQAMSPVDSAAAPEPWPMPGYDNDVIMAAGAFTQGSSIELSCDAPMRPPYTAYLQGGLNFAASRAAILAAANLLFAQPGPARYWKGEG
ncbi:MAG: hypothetical protein GXY32_08020 [Ruminococcaceae bacterium]|nr:hypothetical protein [Oscillospiraceae bacterium]